MPNFVASGTKCVLRQINLRMCAMCFAGPKVDPTSKRTGADQLLDALTLEILKSAYVVLFPLSDGTSSTPPTAASAILARTGDDGTLSWIKPPELDGGPPSDPDRLLWFEPGAQYACFWTRYVSVAKDMWAQVQANAAEAVRGTPFDTFQVDDHQDDWTLPQEVTLQALNRNKLQLLLSDPTGNYGQKLVHGTFSGSLARMYGASEAEPFSMYVMARSDSVASLFLAEGFELFFEEVRSRSSERWELFEQARSIAEQAVNGARVKALDDGLKSIVVSGRTYKAGDWNEDYLEYAYECAKARVERKVFYTAIDMMTNNDSWMEAAAEILEKYGIAHPSIGEDGKAQWNRQPNVMPVLKYFDFYAFGFQNEHASWNTVFLDATNKALEREHRRLRAVKQRLLASRAPYDRFVMDLGAHAKDHATFLALHGLYLDAALGAHFRWWGEGEDKHDRWERLHPYLDATGTLTSKLGDLFKAHFEDPIKVTAYNEALEEGLDAFEYLFKKLNNYNDAFKGGTVKRKYGSGVTIEADFANDTFVIHMKSGEVEKLGPIEFLVDVETVTKNETVVLPKKKSRAMKTKTVTKAKTTVVGHTLVPDPPFKTITKWPVFLNAFGNLVALAVMVKDASVQWRDGDRMQIVGKMAMNTFQTLDSLGAVAGVILRRSTKILEVLEHVGFVGNAIEAYYNVKEGSTLMFDGDESEVVAALARGETVEAKVKMVKGWVLVSSVVPGVVGMGGGAVAAYMAGGGVYACIAGGIAASAGPLVIGLGIGAIVVLGLEVGLVLYNGPENDMAKFQDKIDEAQKKEWGDASVYGKTFTQVDQLVGRLEQGFASMS